MSHSPPLRVLLVEDNHDAASALAWLLQERGHDVRAVGDGLTALETVEVWRPAVVCLDIDLPGPDGYETARRLRQRLGSACPRLVALTGHSEAGDSARAAEAGIDAFLVKPVDPDELLRALTAPGAAAAAAVDALPDPPGREGPAA